MASPQQLRDMAKRLRIHSLEMTTAAGSGHPSSCLSMAEIASVLFFHEMRYNPKDAQDLSNDEFVLSKGHAAPILWACYAEAGIIPLSSLNTLRRMDSILEGHPTPRMQWVKAATGSLGQGICVAAGMAVALRLAKSRARVYCVLGDGECAEGSVWEAANFAARHKLSNLIAIVDLNSLGQNGSSGADVKSLTDRFMAFGWGCCTVEGHDCGQLIKALNCAKKSKGPYAIIAKTVKGKGVSFMENRADWHGRVLNKKELAIALDKLGITPDINPKTFVNPRPSIPFFKKKIAVKTKTPTPSAYNSPAATRDGFGKSLVKLGSDKRIVSLDADVRNSTRSGLFFDKYPDRSFDCLISEQAMIGVAMGLATKGYTPFASTFSAFLTRAHDFIRMAGISRLNVKVCGSHSGVATGQDGPSQMGMEDLAMFRAVPDCVVLQPSDAVSAERCTGLAASYKGMAYLRTSRLAVPIIYSAQDDFVVGGSRILRRSSNDKALVVATGVCVHQALAAYEELKKSGISVRVIDTYSIKPLDSRSLHDSAKAVKGNVIIVEDHYESGGLGEAVMADLSGVANCVHLCVRQVPRSGNPEELMRLYEIDKEAIVRAVRKIIIRILE